MYNQEYLIQEGYHSEAKKRLKSFPGKQKLKEFINTKPDFPEI